MNQFDPDVETLIEKLAQLRQARYWCEDPFSTIPGLGQQCRIYKDGNEWMIELHSGRHYRLVDFFEGLNVSTTVQDGFKVIRGTNRFGLLREVGPSQSSAWYTSDDWERVQRDLKVDV